LSNTEEIGGRYAALLFESDVRIRGGSWGRGTLELENLEVARDEATQSLRELASNAIMQGRPFNYTGIEIADQDGTRLVCVTATDAVPQLSK
jgi:hypothetical protein